MKKPYKSIFRLSVVVLCLLFIVELLLQIKINFFDGTLMRNDEDYEYIAIANQAINRNVRNIAYNSWSMRSEEPDSTKIKILTFGDSIINGEDLTDQDSLATTLLNTSFKKKYQFLNISAGGWGPDNCFAYLKKHGDLKAKHILLFVSSHDAYDNMQFDKSVNYGNRKLNGLALFDFIDRHIYSKYFATKNKVATTAAHHNGFNTGFINFFNYCTAKNISLTIYLHPALDELNRNKYNKQGQEIITFCKKNDIKLVLGLSNNFKKEHYRDNLHLNTLGQKQLAIVVEKSLNDLL